MRTQILVEDLTEEDSEVRNDTSEESLNGRPRRKDSGSGVDRMQLNFKGNTYETAHQY